MCADAGEEHNAQPSVQLLNRLVSFLGQEDYVEVHIWKVSLLCFSGPRMEQPSVRIMSWYLLVSRTWASKVVMLKVLEHVEIHWKNMNIGDKHLAWLELTVCLWTIYNWWGNIPVLDGSQNQRTNPKLLNLCWFFHEKCQIYEKFWKPKTGCSKILICFKNKTGSTEGSLV